MKSKHTPVLEKMIVTACRTNNDWIPGKALGKKPRFFILGDEPNFKDYIMGRPFSGPMDEMFQNCLKTLQIQYPGTKPEDMYLSYLVKTNFQKGQLTEKMVLEEWIPIAQLEYYMSECEYLVGVGPVARMFIQAVQVTPQFIQNEEKGFIQKLKEKVGL